MLMCLKKNLLGAIEKETKKRELQFWKFCQYMLYSLVRNDDCNPFETKFVVLAKHCSLAANGSCLDIDFLPDACLDMWF